MSGKGIKIFAYSALAVFIAATAYVCLVVYNDFNKGPQRAEIEFTELALKTNSLISSSVFMSPDYLAELQKSILNNPRIAALIVYTGSEIQFAYPVSSQFIRADTNGKPLIQIASPLIKTFSTVLPALQDRSGGITAALYILQPADVYKPARLSFLIILACTMAVFIVLLYISLSQKPEIIQSNSDIDFALREQSIGTAQTNEYDESPMQNSFLYGLEKAEELPPLKEEHQPAAEFDFKDELHLTDPTANTIESSADPMGLFSDKTGLGWESYMETRLDAELVRSASSEQDLALVLVRIKNIEKDHPVLLKTAALFLDYFRFRDLVFEYKTDGFAGILLNMNLDQAMVLTESLYRQLESLLQAAGISNKPGIGISTRSLRLLPGSRLIREADQAVEKAFNESPLPIVAFRVNPDKYRQFVTEPADSPARVS